MNVENQVRYVTPADAKGLQALVGKAIASYGRARVAVQVAIVAVLIHAAKHHDYSQANVLVNGLGQTQAGRDAVRFFQDFGGFSVKASPENADAEPEGFNDWKGPGYITEKLESGETRLDVAKATMFWQYRQPRGSVFKEYSTEQLAREFINRINRVRKQAKDGKAKVIDNLSDTTMQEVLNIVKFERIAADTAGETEQDKGKHERKVANG